MGSVAEPRYCAMGRQCTQYPALGEPTKLSRYNKHNIGICVTCWESGLRLGDSPEEYGELFRAARVLFEKDVSDEDLIIPTLAFAARASASDMPWLTQLKDSLLEAGEGSEAWENLWRLFIDTFDTLQPYRIVDGVPLVWRADLYVRLFRFNPTQPKAWVVKRIFIEVHSRSVKPRDVKAKYEKSLRMADIPWERWDRGSVRYKADKCYLSLLVRPEDTEGLDFMDQHLLRTGEQLPFPPPAVVESVYEGVWKCFRDDALKGKQKENSYKPENLIPACVAWYVGGYRERTPNTKLRREVVRALDRYLFEPLGKEELESTSSNRARQLWGAVENAYPLIDRVDQEL
jgi:hypothetical protein